MVAYGYRGESVYPFNYRPLLNTTIALPNSDPYILLIERCLICMAESFGFYFVNVFPLLQHLPVWLFGIGFQRTVRKGRELSAWMAREPHKMAKEIMVSIFTDITCKSSGPNFCLLTYLV